MFIYYKMEEQIESCPLTKEAFTKQLLETNSNYTENELNELYTFFQNSKKGGKRIQKGGVQCGDLHSIYRICCIILLVSAGITCVTSQSVTNIVNHIIWVFKDMLDVNHFRHGYDIIGKTSLTLGFLERFSKFFLEIREKGITPNWLKNIFEIFCKIENDNINIEDAKQQITNVIVTEAIKNENKYTSGIEDSSDIESSSVISDNLTYNGTEIKINIGDAILTISPNTHINQDMMDDDFEERFDKKIAQGKGGKRKKTKGKKKKLIKTKKNKRK